MDNFVPKELVYYQQKKKLINFHNTKQPNRYYEIELLGNHLVGPRLITKQEYENNDKEPIEILMKKSIFQPNIMTINHIHFYL